MKSDISTEEISRLDRELGYHNQRYYEQDAPEISDAQYDLLRKELEGLLVGLSEEEIKQVAPAFFSVGGAPNEALGKIAHKIPMLSLDNALDENESVRFQDSILSVVGPCQIFAEPKFDGLSLSLVYRYGVLQSAITRGDHLMGENVTRQAQTIEDIPKRLNCEKAKAFERFEVRGEVLMTNQNFENINRRQEQLGGRIYANPRNAAAGLLRVLDPEVTRQAGLSFMAYSLVEPVLHSRQSQSLDYLKSVGFHLSEESSLLESPRDIEAHFSKFETRRDNLPYEIDGVVYKVDRLDLQTKMGWRSRTPRFACARKFPAREAVTTLLSIDCQVGRTGVLTPVARVSPVKVSGVTISACTLHNEDEIHRLGLNPGDKVMIKRAGDVIPKITSKVESQIPQTKASTFMMPSSCPVCGSTVTRDSGKSAYRCSGSLNCSAQVKGILSHAVGRTGLNVDGLGEGVLDKVIDKFGLKLTEELFYLTKEQLLTIEGFADKSADNLINALENTVGAAPLQKFLFSLGIPLVGESTARDLCSYFKSDTAYSTMVRVATAAEEDLIQVDGLGPITARSIRQYFDSEYLSGHAFRLLELLKPIQSNLTANQDQSFQGKTFVITGTLGRDRSFFKELIEAKGGKVSGSISSKTDYLLAGESAGSKLGKAESLGVAVLSEEDFNSLVEISGLLKQEKTAVDIKSEAVSPASSKPILTSQASLF